MCGKRSQLVSGRLCLNFDLGQLLQAVKLCWTQRANQVDVSPGGCDAVGFACRAESSGSTSCEVLSVYEGRKSRIGGHLRGSQRRAAVIRARWVRLSLCLVRWNRGAIMRKNFRSHGLVGVWWLSDPGSQSNGGILRLRRLCRCGMRAALTVLRRKSLDRS